MKRKKTGDAALAWLTTLFLIRPYLSNRFSLFVYASAFQGDEVFCPKLFSLFLSLLDSNSEEIWFCLSFFYFFDHHHQHQSRLDHLNANKKMNNSIIGRMIVSLKMFVKGNNILSNFLRNNYERIDVHQEIDILICFFLYRYICLCEDIF